MKKIAIHWFSQDLRLSDNIALQTAIKQGYDVIPLYVFSEDHIHWKMGAASKWWLHHSLTSLSKDLKDLGSSLIIRKGPIVATIASLVKETGATCVFWHCHVEPFMRTIENLLQKELEARGCAYRGFFDNFLFVPGSVLNGKNEPYQVFTPFYKACLLKEDPRSPIAAPSSLPNVSSHIKSLSVKELHLLPKISWDQEFSSLWHPGEASAKQRLKKFISKAVSEYPVMRDFPAIDATSLLSSHLHFGEISVFQIWKATTKAVHHEGTGFLRQLVWREFASHMLYFFPDTDLHPLRREFSDFPWKKNEKALKLWQQGRTGYPIVDAGMRQLWRLGWMHNRLRMIVGSFLVKDLLIPWQDGAEWFWDTLVDADLANNSFGWQWVGGCGADAAPYFRIFNPIMQGEKFDPEGRYVRAFVPELKDMPNEWIHKPWMAPEEVLRAAGVTLGKTYPEPIVDHSVARKQALEYFQSWSKKS
jgi:deoxyribodipyrimidine photo-lyase